MHPTPGTTLFFLGDEGILFCEPRQEVHRFNTTAAVIWCHLEDGLDSAGIVAALQRDSGLTAGDARRFVTEALSDWTAKHLLGAAVPRPPPAPERARPDVPPPPDTEPAATRRYRLLGLVSEVRYTDASHADQVDAALTHLLTDEPATLRVDLVAGSDRIRAYRDGVYEYDGKAADEVVPMVLHLIWHRALLADTYLLDFHAGVVAGSDGCVLLPGVPGAGKSTLTAALVNAGCTYFSDEVGILGFDLMLRPFPLPLAPKIEGLRPLLSMFPSLATAPVHLRSGDAKRIVYLPPPADRVAPATARAKAHALIFPRYTAGAATSVEPVSPADALERLLNQCRYVPRDLSEASVRQLVRWVDSTPAVQLTYGTTAEAVAYVRSWLGES
ncbi:MAG: hypothetical protein U1E70_16100 [Acetobacteraceae bacterium]|nr:hypothetical protein [Pseudomonadota bacterium]